MNKEEAIEWAESRSRNVWLQWAVMKQNDEYIVVSNGFYEKYPHEEYVYFTKENKINSYSEIKKSNNL